MERGGRGEDETTDAGTVNGTFLCVGSARYKRREERRHVVTSTPSNRKE